MIVACLVALVVIEGLHLWLRHRHDFRKWRFERRLARYKRRIVASERKGR